MLVYHFYDGLTVGLSRGKKLSSDVGRVDHVVKNSQSREASVRGCISVKIAESCLANNRAEGVGCGIPSRISPQLKEVNSLAKLEHKREVSRIAVRNVGNRRTSATVNRFLYPVGKGRVIALISLLCIV